MARFNPIETTEQIQEDYMNFFLTSFSPNNPEFMQKLQEISHKTTYLWKGPYIAIPPKPKLGGSFREFEKERIEDKVKDAFFYINRLYKHQEEAIRHVLDGNNTIIAVPTGSGKTEIFMIPILQYCYQNRDKRGTKAILIYPMNALAKDQVERLRKILWKLNQGLPEEEKITFAIYTGDTPRDEEELRKEFQERNISEICPLSEKDMKILGCPKDCSRNHLKYDAGNEILYCERNKNIKIDYQILTRKSIRKNPPDIIVTNYVQLEHILSRKEDTQWLSTGLLKFIVLDEVHSYSGSKGIDVAFLMRRIKKESQSKPIFIGTSATLSQKQNEFERKSSIASFASNIFGEEFTISDVIEAEYEEYVFPKATFVPQKLESLEDLLEEVSDLDQAPKDIVLRILSKINQDFELSWEEPISIELGKALLENVFFQELILKLDTPKSLEEIIQELKESPRVNSLVANIDNKTLKQIVWSYLKLGSKCRDPLAPSRPLINVSVHLFFKTIERIYQCNECGRIYTTPRDRCEHDNSAVDEIGVCRFCGRTFNIVYVDKEEFRKWYAEAKTKKKLRNSRILEIYPKNQGKSYLKKLDYRSEFSKEAVPIWISDDMPTDEKSYIKIKRCRKCGAIIDPSEDTCPLCGFQELYTAYAFIKDPGEGIDTRPVSCPYCGNRYGPYSALSPVAMSSDTASVVVFDRVYTKLPDEYKKLLIFTDNRQIASYLAKHLEDTHFDHAIRVLIHHVVKQRGKVDLPKLFDEAYDIVRYWPHEDLKSTRKPFETAILEEICSLRGRQRSLENLGLIKVSYVGLDDPIKFEQKWKKFIESWIDDEMDASGLRVNDTELWRDLLIAIADIIRQKGAVEGLSNNPPGRSEVVGFSLNQKIDKRHVKVHNFLSKGRTRQRLLFQRVFNTNLKNEILDNALELAFRFLVHEKILKSVELRCCGKFKPEHAVGYVLDNRSLLITIPENVFKCNKCKKIHLVAPKGICLTYGCDGTAIPIQYKEFEKNMIKHNHYFHLYQSENPVKMITAEDTGAIPLKERHKLEIEFKKKDIESREVDVIVATPTLELGVDIGDLISVGIYKAPPSPANYVQRVGRAGRKEKVSLNVTFLYLSPLDRYYYENPEELIRGTFEAPQVNLENRYLLQKHVNAVILYDLIKRSSLTIPRVFKRFSDDNTAERIAQEIENREDYFVDLILHTFKIESLTKDEVKCMINNFIEELEDACDRFRKELDWYDKYIKRLEDEYQELKVSSSKYLNRNKKIREILNRIQRIHEILSNLEDSSTISYLMDVNVLPRYAFPGTYVEVKDVYGREDFEGRSRNVAITELAPLMRVFMKKKVYKSVGIDMEVLKPKEKVFYVCPRCNRYITEDVDQFLYDGCPVCHYKPPENDKSPIPVIEPAIEPNIIYVRRERDNIFQLREYQEASSSIYLSKVSNTETRVSNIDKSIKLTKYLNTEIIKIVDKVIINNEERDIEICEKCGKVKEKLEEEHYHKKLGTGEPCDGQFRKFVLYHRMPTNVISVKLTSDTLLAQSIENIEEFLVTFKNAILNAAQRVLYAQDGEIDGDINIEKREILIYDNVEGGAGYADQIYERFEEILYEAYRIAATCDCEKGCPNCLWSYWRKRDIPHIDKRLLLKSLSRLSQMTINEIIDEERLQKLKKEFQCENAKTTITDQLDGPMKIKKALLSAKQEVYVTSLYITDDKITWPDNRTESWVDVLSLLALKGIKVNVIVRNPTQDKHIRALKRLKENGVNVYIYEKPTENNFFKGIVHAKIIVIDPLKENRRVIFTSANLSSEVTKNVDFYLISEEEECVKKTIQRIRELIAKSKRY